jgi:hypothetical protein
METLDDSNEHGIPWLASTATDDAGGFDGYALQDNTFSTLQYPLEDGHMADTVFNFDLSTLHNLSSGNEQVT